MVHRGMAWRLVCGGVFGRGDRTRQEVAAILSSPALDWREVVVLAGTHLISPALWLGFRAQGLSGSLPEDAGHYLKTLYGLNRARNDGLKLQLRDAIHALNRQGISPMLLKGAAYLMLDTHGDPGARIVSDLDLLIPGEEIETARDALKDIGYFAMTDKDRPGHHHLSPLVRYESPAAVELHTEALTRSCRPSAPTELIRETGEPREDGRYSVPSATHAILHRFLHDQIVDRHADQFVIPLRAVQDLAALVDFYGSKIDWAWLIQRADRFGYAQPFRNYVYAASRVAGMTVPDTLRITRRQQLNYSICQAAEHSPALSRAIAVLDRFSASRIEKQLGGKPLDHLSLISNRLRVLAEMTGSVISTGRMRSAARCHAAWLATKGRRF